MIIKRLIAENILKYRTLKLTDIPASGQIAVAGNNEAGKTAIGETICFALFGRTFSLEPDDIARVIRWGEFQGQVVLEFTGRDGASFAIARQIDNNGKHTVRLQRAGEKEPLAKGVAEVEAAVFKIAGFTYRSFVDSFYLAQREMEVPHAKSATVKALIGVDRLEAVAAGLQEEEQELNSRIQSVDAELAKHYAQIAEIGLDRACLGKLEAQCEVNATARKEAESRATQLSHGANAIRKAGRTLASSCEEFVQSTLHNNYDRWRRREEKITAGLVAASNASQASGESVDQTGLKQAGAALESFERGLASFQKVRELANLHHHRLTDLLDDRGPDTAGSGRQSGRKASSMNAGQDSGQLRFSARKMATLREIDHCQGRVKPLLGGAIFSLESAMAGWVAWAVLLGLPNSSLAGWIQGTISLSETTSQVACLMIALAGSVVAVLLFTKYRQSKHQLRLLDLELENIQAANQSARDELSVIEAMDEAALPDALSALHHLHDPLLKSAATAFAEGDGVILIRPEALSEKLDEIRHHGESAIGSLRGADERLQQRARKERDSAELLRRAAEDYARQIKEEKKRWDQVEGIEHKVVALESQRDALRDDRKVRRLACELIEGACRRIYARFHPELRRFVSRILPELTQERYQHLELDDDLGVRVYCNEKNDFVGLAEISNGTHRQLMLCVRLALAQALIASSSNSNQFIFFDEPFVFFDEHRMAKAIGVLGKLSPQIMQVWVAAQTFSDPSRFDMIIDCRADAETLEAAGSPAKSELVAG